MTSSVYIHIPFCMNICTYCDFCKLYKNDQWIEAYLQALEKEIKSNYQNEKIKTLYFGGGTPSALTMEQLDKLFTITSIFDLTDDCEITFECNVEDLTEPKLEFLKDKVNRLSIGLQSFQPKILSLLGRAPVKISNIILAKKYFDNINLDLMYGFKEQTLEDLKKDIQMVLKLDVSHISAYSLIVEPHTKLFINNYKLDDDIKKDQLLNKMLVEKGYNHYEISNYAKPNKESKHNLTYWNNECYYGFGLGASGYINNIRYDNTRNLNSYLKGNYCSKINKLNENETLQNEFILGLRKLSGINKKEFYRKYGFNILEVKNLHKLIAKDLIKNEDNIYINPKYLYFSNEILINFIGEDLHKH